MCQTKLPSIDCFKFYHNKLQKNRIFRDGFFDLQLFNRKQNNRKLNRETLILHLTCEKAHAFKRDKFS